MVDEGAEEENLKRDLGIGGDESMMVASPSPENMDMCVPMKAVAAEDGGENAVAPEVGDEVNMAVKGTVTRVEGDNIYIRPTEVNGEKVGEPKIEEESTNVPPADEGAGLRDSLSVGGGMQ